MLVQLQNDHKICSHVKVFFYFWEWNSFPNDSLFIVWNESRTKEDFEQPIYALSFKMQRLSWTGQTCCSNGVCLRVAPNAKKSKKFWSWKGFFRQRSRDKIHLLQTCISLSCCLNLKKQKTSTASILREPKEPSIPIFLSALPPKLLSQLRNEYCGSGQRFLASEELYTMRYTKHPLLRCSQLEAKCRNCFYL